MSKAQEARRFVAALRKQIPSDEFDVLVTMAAAGEMGWGDMPNQWAAPDGAL